MTTFGRTTKHPTRGDLPAFCYPPWYLLRTRKQRIRFHRLARRAGRNPDWIKARYATEFTFAFPENLDRFACPIIYKKRIDAEFVNTTHDYTKLMELRETIRKDVGTVPPGTPIEDSWNTGPMFGCKGWD